LDEVEQSPYKETMKIHRKIGLAEQFMGLTPRVGICQAVAEEN
jgi:hypothetical protein